MRLFGIIRVSGPKQKDKYGPKAQWRDFEKFAAIWPNGPHYLSSEDSATVVESASEWNRPMWEQVVAEGIRRFRAGLIDAFLIGRVDRETRNLFASIPILRMAIDAGVPVFFAQEKLQLNPKDPEAMDRYLREAQDSIAYIRKLVKNTTPGRIERAKEGRLPCNTPMFGFDIVDGYRVVNPAQKAAICQAVEVTLKEGRPGAGRRWLNEHGWRTTQGKPFSTQALTGRAALFRNRALMGETVIKFKDEMVVIHHDRILDDSTFDALQVVLDSQGVRERRTQFYALSGISDCGCGARFESSKCGNHRYYRCAAYCGEKVWRKDDFEWAVWNSFGDYLNECQNRMDYLQLASQSVTRLQDDLRAVSRDIETNTAEWRALLDKDLSDYPAAVVNDKKRELSAEAESLRWRKAQIEAELLLLPQVDAADVERELATIAAPWLMCDWTTREETSSGCLPREQAEILRQTLMRLGARARVQNGEIRIIGRLPIPIGANAKASKSLYALW